MLFLSALETIHSLLWGMPLICLILIVGIYLTIKLKGIQIFKIKKAFNLFKEKDNTNEGEVSTFQAICISLSATIGTGNIIGVASAIMLGGVGALFWMIVCSVFGMAIKYVESFLAIKYRIINNNTTIGGPFAYIEKGMGSKYKWLSKVFALCTVGACVLGLGTFIQINGIVDAFENLFGNYQNVIYTSDNITITTVSVIVGSIITILSAIILIGGVQRIGKVCEVLVPFMAIFYVSMCLLLLVLNIKAVPDALILIVKEGLNIRSFIGGALGIQISEGLRQGMLKGIFITESGLGSSPIAISTAKSTNPVKEGLVTMVFSLLSVILICVSTGLCIIVTKAHTQGLSGIAIMNYAFSIGLNWPNLVVALFVLICITCFAFSTIIGWNLYGEKALSYLTNNSEKAILIYKYVYIFMVLIGSILELNLIWKLAEVLNALMAIPNLIAVVYLSKVAIKETNIYLKKKK